MKFLAILVLLYAGLGFFGGVAILTALGGGTVNSKTSAAEDPPWQLPLTALLIGLLIALPIVGYRRARKQGSFLHCGAKIWLTVPASLVLIGLLGAVAFRVLNPSLFRAFVSPGQ